MNEETTGIDPPLPIITGGLPYSSASAAWAARIQGRSVGNLDPWGAAIRFNSNHSVRRQPFGQEAAEALHHRLRLLARHQTERHFGERL